MLPIQKYLILNELNVLEHDNIKARLHLKNNLQQHVCLHTVCITLDIFVNKFMQKQ